MFSGPPAIPLTFARCMFIPLEPNSPGPLSLSTSTVSAGRSFVNVRAVDVAVHKARALMDEMEDADPEHWLPEHTLHLFVDLMLRALGWEPSDPGECRPFFPGTGLAGYSLSAVSSGDPNLIVLAAPPGTSLAESASRVWLDSEAVPTGVVVLTDGARWRVYHRGRLAVEVDLVRLRRGTAAGVLTEWLGRANFG